MNGRTINRLLFQGCLLVLGWGCLPSLVVFAGETSRFFSSNGVQIHYVDEGIGDPIVLMHGLNMDFQRTWFDSGVAQKLIAAGYRVLAFDARAHGLSGTPHDPALYGVEMSLDVARLIEHVGIEKAHIVGYSMGARIVSKLREIQPGCIATLTLGGYEWTEVSGPPPTFSTLADSLERGEGFMPLYADLYPNWTEQQRRARSDAMVARLPDVQATVAMLRGYDFGVSEENLRKNTVPLLAVVGAADPRAAGLEAFEEVARNLELVLVPNAEHQEVTGDPMFVEAILDFFERHPVSDPEARQ